MLCSFKDCDRPARTKGLCMGHEGQIRRGLELSPLKWKRREKGSEINFVFDEVYCPRFDLNGPCQVYKGAKYNGYGRAWNGKRNVLVYKYLWEKKNGEIPDKLVLDHQCCNRGCCNIEHLRLVTRKVNSTENIFGHPWQLGKAKTHCKRNHEFNEVNTRYTNGRRVCKICEYNNQKIRLKRKKQ